MIPFYCCVHSCYMFRGKVFQNNDYLNRCFLANFFSVLLMWIKYTYSIIMYFWWNYWAKLLSNISRTGPSMAEALYLGGKEFFCWGWNSRIMKSKLTSVQRKLYSVAKEWRSKNLVLRPTSCPTWWKGLDFKE